MNGMQGWPGMQLPVDSSPGSTVKSPGQYMSLYIPMPGPCPRDQGLVNLSEVSVGIGSVIPTCFLRENSPRSVGPPTTVFPPPRHQEEVAPGGGARQHNVNVEQEALTGPPLSPEINPRHSVVQGSLEGDARGP